MDINKLRTYILETDFRINIVNNKVNIVNYEEIDHFDSNKIIVRHNRGRVIISGNNLIVTRLLKDEILIEGKIKLIEMNNNE